MEPVEKREALQGKESETIDERQNQRKQRVFAQTERCNTWEDIVLVITLDEQFHQIRLNSSDQRH